jgi:GDP-L-fucose synthase
MEKDSQIYVAGHKGLVGSAIVRSLVDQGFDNLVVRSFGELDLRRQAEVEKFFDAERPEFVFLAAAKVGGILANSTYPADFIYDNLMIQSNVIHQAYVHGVKRLLFLGSTCIYPKEAPQPLREEYLLTGPLEPTNEPYAVAKIAGIRMCQSYNRQYGTDFISVLPTNLYGPNDNFDPETSHVLPALLDRIHRAKVNGDPSVTVWGSGTPMREFMWSEDMADACVHVMTAEGERMTADDKLYNIGTEEEVSIRELAELICQTVGYQGELRFDPSKPDGTMRKVTDCTRLHALGYTHRISLKEGLKKLYQWYTTP